LSDTRFDPEPTTEAEEAYFTRLASQVELNLRLGRQVDAARAADELLERWPDSTTASELAGDVAAAEGQVSRAREHYKRALELEPANADAERKYGASLLAQTPEERRAALIQQIIADPSAHRASARRPLNAVLNALLFPGLGQLYNREQEKGLAMLGGAAVTAILLLSVVMPYLSASLTLGSPNARAAQRESAQAVMDGTGTGQWLLVTICGLTYVALYAWGIFDAWKHAQSETEQTLGVH
jgi:tetratricopeptide (TPR) repeat protein